MNQRHPYRRRSDRHKVIRNAVALVFLVVAVIGIKQLIDQQIRQDHGIARDQQAACQQVEQLKVALRATIDEAQRFAATSPVRSAAEKRATVTFYSDTLRRLAARSCPGEHRLARPPVVKSAVRYGTVNAATPQRCASNIPVGQGHMGVCAPHPVALGPVQTVPLTAGQRLFVDVYEGDGAGAPGCINWAAHRTPAVIKALEQTYQDHCFNHNYRQLRSLGLWHAVYAFLRPGDCAGQGWRTVARIRAAGGPDARMGPVFADAEVPLNTGCVAQFTQAVRQGLHWAVSGTYTGPGTYPGGGQGILWVAAYGAYSSPLTQLCIWTCPTAWQSSDGSVGPLPHCVAGICGDTDRDLRGLLSIHYPAACGAACRKARLRRELNHDYRLRRQLRVLLTRHGCRIHPRQPRACPIWLREGQQVNRRITALHKQGV